MIIGITIQTFTILHVIITLIAISTGFIVMFGMFGSNRLSGWTAIFLLLTLLTSVTGFMFPIRGFTPALGVGIVAMVVLAIALLALYAKHLAAAWRWLYAVTAVVSLYLNMFVLIVQAFQKVSLLNPLSAAGWTAVLRADKHVFCHRPGCGTRILYHHGDCRGD